MLTRFARRIADKHQADGTTLRHEDTRTDPNAPDASLPVRDHDDVVAVRDESESDNKHDGSPDTEIDSDTEVLEYDADPVADGLDKPPDQDAVGESAPQRTRTTRKAVALALVASTLIVAILGALIGYLAYRTHETRLATAQRELFLQAGSQAAINLTTISYTQADADVARILDSATGTFHDDFQKRAQPFIDVVKQAHSTSQGNVTAVGLESVDGDRAQVIVAISVKTANAGAPEQKPRGWRMRISVQKVGDAAKVSDVQFVP